MPETFMFDGMILEAGGAEVENKEGKTQVSTQGRLMTGQIFY